MLAAPNTVAEGVFVTTAGESLYKKASKKAPELNSLGDSVTAGPKQELTQLGRTLQKQATHA